MKRPGYAQVFLGAIITGALVMSVLSSPQQTGPPRPPPPPPPQTNTPTSTGTPTSTPTATSTFTPVAVPGANGQTCYSISGISGLASVAWTVNADGTVTIRGTLPKTFVD